MSAHLGRGTRLFAATQEGGYHQTYLALYRHIRQQDRLVADCFDNWSRSRALQHLLLWRQHHLLTDQEFAAFTPETRARVVVDGVNSFQGTFLVFSKEVQPSEDAIAAVLTQAEDPAEQERIQRFAGEKQLISIAFLPIPVAFQRLPMVYSILARKGSATVL